MSFNDYLLSSSIHGLRYVSKLEKTPSRVFWSLAVISCAGWAGYLIYESYYEWEASPFVTNIEMVDVEDVPFPELSISTDVTTKWQAIAYMLKKLDEQGDVKELFARSPSLRRKLEYLVSHVKQFLRENVYLANHSYDNEDELRTIFDTACSLTDEMNWSAMQKFAWLEKILKPLYQQNINEFYRVKNLLNTIEEEIELKFSAIKDEALQNNTIQSLNISKDSLCPITDLEYPATYNFELALKSTIVENLNSDDLIEVLCTFLGNGLMLQKYSRILQTLDSKEIISYIERQSTKMPEMKEVPLTFLIDFLTSTSEQKLFDWGDSIANPILDYKQYPSVDRLKKLTRKAKDCFQKVDIEACNSLSQTFKDFYHAANGSVVRNIADLSKFGNTGSFFKTHLTKILEVDDIAEDFGSAAFGQVDPLDSRRVNVVYNKLSKMPTTSISMRTDLTIKHDFSAREGLFLSPRRPGVFNFNSKRALDLRLTPNEHVVIDIGVEIFDVSETLKAKPVHKRHCLVETDPEWQLQLFDTYGESNCKIEKASMTSYKQTGCIPINYLAFDGKKLESVFGKSPKFCSLGDQLRFMSEFTKAYSEDKDCLSPCHDIIYTFQPRRYSTLEKHHQYLINKKTTNLNLGEELRHHAGNALTSIGFDSEASSNQNKMRKISLINMRFSKTKYQKIVKGLRATSNDKIALIGGTMGLFTGISFISCFEALFWIFKAFKFRFPSACSSSCETNEKEMLHLS